MHYSEISFSFVLLCFFINFVAGSQKLNNFSLVKDACMYRKAILLICSVVGGPKIFCS